MKAAIIFLTLHKLKADVIFITFGGIYNMKQTLADKAYEQLLDRIYSLEYQEDNRIVEQQLIELLGIGRTPVREAIRRLAGDGLIDLSPGTFARIHTFSDKEKQDMGVVRLALDTAAAPLVILNGSNRDFQNLLVITTECQKAFERNDIIERLRLDFEFHTMLISISGNRELTTIQKQLTKRGMLMQIQSYCAEGSSFCDLTGHLNILQALNARDTNACIRCMQDHLKYAYTTTPEAKQEWQTVESALNKHLISSE